MRATISVSVAKQEAQEKSPTDWTGSEVGSGRYVIKALVGKSPLGETYRARARGAEGFEKPVLVAMLRPEWTATDGVEPVLVEDLTRAMRLAHANVVQVLDMGYDQERLFVVREWVDGEPLDYILRRAQRLDQKLPAAMALHIASEACRGLAHASRRTARDEHPFLHGLLRPHSIWLTDEGQVKVAGFGYGRARAIATSALLGTEIAAATPEALRGEPLTKASDVFLLGSVIFELLSGRHPFLDSSAASSLIRAREGLAAIPERDLEAFDPDVRSLLMRLLDPDPRARLEDAGAVHDAIEAMLAERGEHFSSHDVVDFLENLERLVEERGRSLLPSSSGDSLAPLLGSPTTKPPRRPVSRSLLKKTGKLFTAAATGQSSWATFVGSASMTDSLLEECRDRLARSKQVVHWIELGAQIDERTVDEQVAPKLALAGDHVCAVIVRDSPEESAIDRLHLVMKSGKGRALVLEIRTIPPQKARGAVFRLSE